MLRGVITVGGWTMASRVLGFARDMLIAARLGAGPMADAFFVALQLPNLFRRLFGEGAFAAAFVPAFAGAVATQGRAAARELAERMAPIPSRRKGREPARGDSRRVFATDRCGAGPLCFRTPRC